VSPALEALVLRTLEKAPESRPSAAALAATLPASLDASVRKTRVLGPPAATRVLLRPGRRSRSDRGVVAALAALSAVGLLAAGVVRATDRADGSAGPPPKGLSVATPPPSPTPPPPPPAIEPPPPAQAPVVSNPGRGKGWAHGKGKKKGHGKHGKGDEGD
jgi:hypothetical protein